MRRKAHVWKLAAAAAMLLAMWGLDSVRDGRAQTWSARGRSGPVRILQFYASVGTVQPGETAQICYGVVNARSVRISPVLPGVYPSPGRCLGVTPEHTTHYTILAEGYDGTVAVRSLTLPVMIRPVAPPQYLHFAIWLR